MEAALGGNHPDVAASLHHLASLYYFQGAYARAEPLYTRALAIEEVALGENHPRVAASLDALALLYKNQGLHARAESLYVRALAIRQAALGQNHPDIVASLRRLAHLYKEQGAYARAWPLYERALALEQGVAGETPFDFAAALHHLANLYSSQGLYARAEPLYARALPLEEAARGTDSPEFATLLNDFALLQVARHHLTEALSLFTRALELSEQRLRQEALTSSEERLTRLLHLLRGDEELLYSLLRAHPDDPRVQRLALSAALLRKGRSVAEIADTSRTLYRGLGAEDRALFERLRALRTQLARLSLEGRSSLPAAEYQRRLEALTDESASLEAYLARRSAPLRALTSLPAPDSMVDRVASALPEDSALVEFIAYIDTSRISELGVPESRTSPRLRYLALVLFPDGRIRARELGPAESIDAAATRLRDALANRDATFEATARSLHHLVFQPLLPLLGETRRLFLAPDGQLSLVPFAALHDGHGFLIDSFRFTYLTSGRDLLPRPPSRPPSRSVVVLADPAFRAPHPTLSSRKSAPARATRSTSLEQFFSSRRSDVAEGSWVPLPGTRREAKAIHRLFPQAQLFLDSEASKERLLHLSAPGVLHLATHGFFLEDSSAPKGSRGVGHFGALGDDPFAPQLPDPLLRSGLVLSDASAPRPDAPGSPRPSPGSALVTALELAGLDLWGTELVVLSACDTGRGDVRLGQGVYGLRRAFVVAGAETVVMSLWKVNDETTRELMEAYYRNLLAGHGRATALHEAMRSLRATHPHPHHWAPFIALGLDAPLRAFSASFPALPAPAPGRGRVQGQREDVTAWRPIARGRAGAM
jgi:CHAT domain-containing protein